MLKIKAPAKINIFLDVETPAREDGFHKILSVAGKISLFDEVFLTEAAGISLEVDSPWKIPRGSGNLCMKAARTMRKFAPSKGVKIKLKKRIPPGSGLGGGSSDAAAVIRGINKLWRLNLKDRELQKAGASAGSDVPLFLHPGPFCRIEGRGERIIPVRKKITGFVVLWFGKPLSTRDVYRQLDKKRKHPRSKLRGIRISPPLTGGDKGEGGKEEKMSPALFYNILEEAAFDLRPYLLKKKNIFLANGAAGAGVSGSGSTVFGLFSVRVAAENFCREHSSCQITEFL
ncbi:MAG: 4-(cytidine 5'-diphospho)-2-C-methyl-D-erythritol kinase [bacterium]